MRRRRTKRDDDGELVFGFKSSECHNYAALQLEHVTTWKNHKEIHVNAAAITLSFFNQMNFRFCQY